VRQVLRFLVEHTGARRAHILVEPDNLPSLRVARSVGATEVGRLVNAHGQTLLRHVLTLV
jgi:RimJ/RimL family protein N-acetyltransferase